MENNSEVQHAARLAGWAYLAIIALGLFGEAYVRGTMLVSGNAAASLQNISANPVLWRLSIAGDLLMHVLDIPVTIFFYLLLRPVSHPLALISTAFNLVQTSILGMNKINLLAPFTLMDASAVAFHTIWQHSYGFAIGLIFFGVTCIIRDALIYRSTLIPRAIGGLIIVAGACYLVNSFALILAPSLAAAMFPAILFPAFIGELALSLWLILKGVKVEAAGRAANLT